MNEVYSMTEICGHGFSTMPIDLNSYEHVGGLEPTMEWKFIDAPECQAFVNQEDADGVLRPRGEILIRGVGLFSGYYKDEAKTDKVVDQDGWYHSGDIGELVPEKHNALRIIDRINSCFKNSQGTYIHPNKLEQLYKQSKFVKDIWVFADSKWDHIFAVVNVHQKEFYKEMLQSGIWSNKDLTFESLSNNEIASDKILWHMQRSIEKVPKIKVWEILKNIHIEPTNFSDLGLYTFNGKMNRKAMKERYYEKLEKLYQKSKKTV